MTFLAVFVVFATSLAPSIATNILLINTPASAVQCVPTIITFSGGEEPFTLTCVILLITDSATNNQPITETFTGLTGTSFAWSTNVLAGTTAALNLTDSNGVTAFSAPFVVQNSDDTSCL
ncbi:hypothetical protein C8Q79DRAFT_1006025 [Trametes meyenii]|nr:hypothetical protein C8Q79DRAFT_1006025 [Trametes meyenii]